MQWGIELQIYELTGIPCDGSQRMDPYRKNILNIRQVHPNFTTALWYAYPERLRVMARRSLDNLPASAGKVPIPSHPAVRQISQIPALTFPHRILKPV
jgi:hypothetical protein